MSSLPSLTPFLLLSIATVAQAAIGPVADLKLYNGPINPDGFERDAVLIEGANGVIGPLIQGNKGDHFKINVVNNLNNPNMNQSTSIHWHGLFMSNGQNWVDGPAFITQCPIANNGASFSYEFQETEQTGTYWYHSHVAAQYCDGLRGPMVIYDPRDPYRRLYDVDDESTVITLGDWYHIFAKDVLIPNPDATLVNGLGRYAGGNATELAVVKVRRHKRYRLRFINLACDPWYRVSIDDHPNLLFIEADGIETVPVRADHFDILAGQRYSVILKANRPIGNYWIRVAQWGVDEFSGGLNSAILRYDGAPEEEPTTTQNTYRRRLLEEKLAPLKNPGAPGTPGRGNADVARVLKMDFDPVSFTFFMNGVAYHPPPIPVLLQVLSGAATAQSLMPAGTFIEVHRGDIVELTIPPFETGGPHPFHLHGHAFDVIRTVEGTSDNYINPPRRDVVSTGMPDQNSNVTIRFRADNPGPWILHCHIDFHLEHGLAIFIAEAVDEWDTTIQPNAAWDALCPAFNEMDPIDT